MSGEAEKMVSVKLTGPLVFSADRVLLAGQVHSFPEAEALRLVEGNAAVFEQAEMQTADAKKPNKR